MANDDVNINRPATSSLQNAPPVSDGQIPPSSSTSSPRVDAGNVQASGRSGQGVFSSGPNLDLPKVMSTSAMATMLMALEQKISTARVKNAKDKIKEETQNQQDADKKRIGDIKKMMKAKEKAHHHGLLGKIFGWVGVALTYVAAAVVTVVTGGAAAAPLFAAAVLMTGLMIAQQTGGIHKFAQAVGMNDKAEMGLMIGLTAAVLVVSIVPVVMSGGAAAMSLGSTVMSMISEATATGAEVGAGAAELGAAGAEAGSTAAEISADATEAAAEGAEVSTTSEEASTAAVDASSEMADAGAEAGDSTTEVSETSEQASQTASKADDADSTLDEEEGSDVVEKSASKTQKVAARVGNVVNLASGGAQVGSGATGIQLAEDQHDVAMAEADATDQQAVIANVQALQAATIRKLRKILEEMQANTKTIFSIVSSSNLMQEEISKGSSV
ncbi:MAG: type III secretion system translocon subunit SctE [Chromatiales bacterium]|nr:type III secretion system translocon subunit SctE [Chromatiales bacterium]